MENVDEIVVKLRNLHRAYVATDNAKPGQLFSDAADALEVLSREVEEYKAAYRKEHNKRIVENRYLYDELTKAVREKLLMTPMRIEVPEPPGEET